MGRDDRAQRQQPGGKVACFAVAVDNGDVFVDIPG